MAMEKKTYLIFGATGGMGRAISVALTNAGHQVHLAARNPEKLEELASELGASFSVCDVLLPEQIKAAVEAAGPEVAGLVYAVGSIDLKPLRSTAEDSVHKAFSLNATGAMLAVQAAEKALKTANGSVLLFSTVAVGQGFANHTTVSMVKGAVEGLTRALAAELAPKVRVNAIAPSLTATAMAAPLLGNETMRSSLAKVHPLGRLGEVEDMVGLATTLLGPSGNWITGQVIGVDGGRGALAGRG